MKRNKLLIVTSIIVVLCIISFILIYVAIKKKNESFSWDIPNGHIVYSIQEFVLADNFSFEESINIYAVGKEFYGIIYSPQKIYATRNIDGKNEKDLNKIAEVVISLPEDMYRLLYQAEKIGEIELYLVNDTQEFNQDKTLYNFTQIKDYIENR